MPIELIEPAEDDSIDCHLQQIGMGSLICRAAQQTGQKNTTNEVTPAVCFSCDVGRIFREVGCDAPLPKITVHNWGHGNPHVEIDGIFCKIRRRYTTLEYCHTCTLATAESTRQIVTSTRGLFQSHGFYAAYQDLEKARLSIRDGEFARSITHSIACLESTCRIIHEELGEELPKKKQLTDLWKSTRAVLDLDGLTAGDTLAPLLNSLHGAVTQIGAMRNALSDAHGRGTLPPHVSEAMAELAMNSAATVATFAFRHYRSRIAGTTS
ncbi:MAG: hypothetical protein FJ014_13395 [Chloroflexi bacterium]|nr:hypothetical protein [Chloroflexota bacterium]